MSGMFEIALAYFCALATTALLVFFGLRNRKQGWRKQRQHPFRSWIEVGDFFDEIRHKHQEKSPRQVTSPLPDGANAQLELALSAVPLEVQMAALHQALQEIPQPSEKKEHVKVR